MEGPLKKYPVPHAGLVIALMFVIVVLGYLAVKIPSPDGWSPITGFAIINASGNCGNNTVESWANEQCDGGDDLNCPGRCKSDCTCRGEERRTTDLLSRQTFYFVKVDANHTEKFSFERKNISFAGGEFFVPLKQESFRIIVDVNITPRFPQPDGINYQFFEIQLQNISDRNITQTNITFHAFKKWIAEANINTNTITLMRLPDQKSSRNEWLSLKTVKIEERTDDILFYADGGGLLQGVYGVNAYRNPNCGDNFCDSGESNVNCCTDCSCYAGASCTDNTCISVECGNNIINEGETSATCCLDVSCPSGYTCQHNECQLVAGCGDNQCSSEETVTNCPQDCTKPTLLNPMFIFIIIGLASVGVVIAAVVFGVKFTFSAQKKLKKHHQLLLAMVSNEGQLREFIKQSLATTPLPELRKKLIASGWERTLIDSIFEDMRPAISEILPHGMTLEKYVRKLLAHKSIDEVKTELQLKGWPMHRIDSVIKTVALEKLAERFLMNKTPYSPEKFHRFVKATKLLGYSYDAIKKALLDNGWDEKIFVAELGTYFI